MANTYKDFSFSQIDPRFKQLLDWRNQIIRGETLVTVHQNLQSFFQSYATAIGSPTTVEESTTQFTYGNSEIRQPMCVMYSDGSDSAYMDETFCSTQCIRGHDFDDFEIRDGLCYPREFQLALIGMYLGVGVTMIGVSSMLDSDVNTLEQEGRPHSEYSYPALSFEWSDDFVNLWNTTFVNQIQYPIQLVSKPQIYRTLFHLGRDFNVCEHSSEPPCGKCWKCVERWFLTQALNQNGQYIGDAPEVDPEYLAQVRQENVQYLEQNIDPYDSMSWLKRLETHYGYTGWR